MYDSIRIDIYDRYFTDEGLKIGVAVGIRFTEGRGASGAYFDSGKALIDVPAD